MRLLIDLFVQCLEGNMVKLPVPAEAKNKPLSDSDEGDSKKSTTTNAGFMEEVDLLKYIQDFQTWRAENPERNEEGETENSECALQSSKIVLEPGLKVRGAGTNIHVKKSQKSVEWDPQKTVFRATISLPTASYRYVNPCNK